MIKSPLLFTILVNFWPFLPKMTFLVLKITTIRLLSGKYISLEGYSVLKNCFPQGYLSTGQMGLRVDVGVMSTQKCQKTLKFWVLVLCQVPLETIMRVSSLKKILKSWELTLEAPSQTSWIPFPFLPMMYLWSQVGHLISWVTIELAFSYTLVRAAIQTWYVNFYFNFWSSRRSLRNIRLIKSHFFALMDIEHAKFHP